MNGQPASSKGWNVALAGLGVNLVLGGLYSWSVMAKALVGQKGWLKTDASWPFTVATIAFSVMMIFAGRMQDKAGPRRIAMMGGVMLGLGLALSALAVDSWKLMMLTFGVVGGVGIGLAYSSTTPPALKWFPPARKGLIAGIVVSGVSLAPFYDSPLKNYLLTRVGIPATFVILALGAVVVITVMSTLLTNPPAGYVAAGAAPAGGPARAAAPRRDTDWPQMIRTPQFWMLWLILALTAAAGLMIIAHLAVIAKMQAKIEWGFTAVMLLALFNTAGRLVGGYCSDKIGRANTMLLFFALQAVNMFAFHFYTTGTLLLVGAAATGLCYGTIFTLLPATTADYYGMKHLGVNYGFVFTAFGVAGALGPIMAGMIADTYKSYDRAYVICAVMLIIGAVLALVLRAPRAEPVPPAPAPAPKLEKV